MDDSSVESIRARIEARRAALREGDDNLPKSSQKRSPSRLSPQNHSESKRVSVDQDSPTGTTTPSESASRRSLYPVDDLDSMARTAMSTTSDESDKRKEQSPPVEPVLYVRAADPKERKSRFAALSANLEQFEVEDKHVPLVGPRHDTSSVIGPGGNKINKPKQYSTNGSLALGVSATTPSSQPKATPLMGLQATPSASANRTNDQAQSQPPVEYTENTPPPSPKKSIICTKPPKAVVEDVPVPTEPAVVDLPVSTNVDVEMRTSPPRVSVDLSRADLTAAQKRGSVAERAAMWVQTRGADAPLRMPGKPSATGGFVQPPKTGSCVAAAVPTKPSHSVTPLSSRTSVPPKRIVDEPVQKPPPAPIPVKTRPVSCVSASAPPTNKGNRPPSNVEIVEESHNIQSLRRRWEVAATTGALLHPDKKSPAHQLLSVVAPTKPARVTPPRQPSPPPLETTPSTTADQSSYISDMTSTPACPEEPLDDGSVVTDSFCFDNSQTDEDQAGPAGDSDALSPLPTPSRPKPVPQPRSTPLVHTLSFYRQQEQRSTATPVRTVVKPPSPTKEPDGHTSSSFARKAKDATYEKIKDIQTLLAREASVISQTTRALAVSRSTDEFRGTETEIEAERILLEHCTRRECNEKEMRRLQELILDGGPYETGPWGTVNIVNISIPLKRQFINQVFNGDHEFIFYFIVLVCFRDQVLHTVMLSSEDDSVLSAGRLAFTNYMTLKQLPANFDISLQLFVIQTRREIRRDPNSKTPKKEKSSGLGGLFTTYVSSSPLSQALHGSAGMDPRQLPAGSVIGSHSSRFVPSGRLHLTLSSVGESRFHLEGVPNNAPHESRIHMDLRCNSEFEPIENYGFLNVQQDSDAVSDWSRLWCRLGRNTIRLWRYPDDEETHKDPIGVLDLADCLDGGVAFCDNEICARAHTMMLRLSENRNVLLSAENAEEGQIWLKKINKVLAQVDMWRPSARSPTKASAV